jgi:hypothetical protein
MPEAFLASRSEVLFFAVAATSRRPLAASSDGSSRVLYVRHVVDLKCRRVRPSLVVDVPSAGSVESVLRRNLSKPCHVASSK